MTKEIFIENANHNCKIESSIVCITVEDVETYRDIRFHPFESITYSIDGAPASLNRTGLVIDNVYNIDINDKKYLNQLYKRLSNNAYQDEQMLSTIKSNLSSLVEEMIYNDKYLIEFDEDIDIVKLLALFQVKYVTMPDKRFLENIVNFIKLNTEICTIRIVITYDLIRQLTNDEIELLKKELEILDIVLVDITLDKIRKEVQYIQLDETNCII